MTKIDYKIYHGKRKLNGFDENQKSLISLLRTFNRKGKCHHSVEKGGGLDIYLGELGAPLNLP